MTFRLVAPSVWRSVLQESEFGIVEPRLAAAILVSLQDAHAGITPRLAEGLAVAITRRSGKAASVWDRLFANLVDSLLDAPLSGEMPGARRSASPFGLFAGANRLATILQVAQPLILEACATCRRTFLLCGEEARGSVTQQEYAKYDIDLEAALGKLAEKNAENQFFRYVQSNILSSFSHDAGNVASTTSLPEIDTVAAAVLLGLKPQLPPARWTPNRPPKPSRAPRNRPSPGSREESVEGIRFSSREEDLGGILHSEFLLPKPLFLERITSRFLIHERRPHHQKLRHVAVIAIMPHQVRASMAGAFLKACWFDCMARLGLQLANHRLYLSEFRWVEGDAFDRVRDCSFFLEDLAPLGQGLVMTEQYRSRFLTSLRWLPSYLDTRADFRTARDPDVTERQDGADQKVPDAIDWAVAAWRTQKDSRRWQEETVFDRWDDGDPDLAPKLHVSRFSFVHVMVFLPADSPAVAEPKEAEPTNLLPAILGRLYGEFGLACESRRNLSVTVVAESAGAPGWKYCARNGFHRTLGREADGDRAKLAGELERAWLDQLVQEVWHG